jgi:hypothetical protein
MMTRLSVNRINDEVLQKPLTNEIEVDDKANYVDHLISRIRDAEDLWTLRGALNEMDAFLDDNVEWEDAFSKVANIASLSGDYDSDGMISANSPYYMDYDEDETPGSRYSVKERWEPDEDD